MTSEWLVFYSKTKASNDLYPFSCGPAVKTASSICLIEVIFTGIRGDPALEKHRRILVVSASIGAGHHQAAYAIKAAWKSQFPDDNIQIADFMSESSSHFNHLIKEAYLKAISFSPDIYEFIYRWSQQNPSTINAQQTLAWVMQLAMARLIKRYRPNVVVCTHPFPCGAISYLKTNKGLNLPVVGVVTDFAIHRFWINAEVDQYLVATPELKAALMERGVSPDNIVTTGIPIHPSFALSAKDIVKPVVVNEAPVILIMGGGFGFGPLCELLAIVNKVEMPLRVMVVTGNNTALREKLQALTAGLSKEITVLGYVKDIRELMASADILITKPGALTICEALAMELPMLFYQAIPGQEMENARYIITKGAAQWIGGEYKKKWKCNGDKIVRQITELLQNPSELVLMQSAAKELCRPLAAAAAVHVINRQLLDRKTV